MKDTDKMPRYSANGYIVMSGNLNEGFTAYGPYPDFEDAASACEGAEAWIMSLGTLAEAEIEL